MKKRLLITLLTFGLTAQSLSIPVLAAPENMAGLAGTVSSSELMESEVPGDFAELTGPTGVGILSETAKPGDSGGEGEDAGSIREDSSESTEPADSEDTDHSEDISGTGESSNGEDISDADESQNGLDSEQDAENEASDPKEAGQNVEDEESDSEMENSEGDDSLAVSSLMEEEELIEYEYVGDGEGVYQEGSFTVLGQSASGSLTPSSINPYLLEQDRAEAEEYLYQQILLKAAEIDLKKYNISRGDIGSFVRGVINEHPDLYFVSSGFNYSVNGDIVTRIRPEYYTEYDEDDDRKFRLMVDDALSEIDDGMTDLQKAIALHDYIVLNCAYDYQNYLNHTLPREVYTAYGVLVNGSAVCQGYALAYKLLLNKVGIECYMVTSDKMNHAWNLIKLDGQYYQVDATWDDPVWDRFGLVGHNYMFLSDTEFQTDSDVRDAHHDWVITKGSLTVDLVAGSNLYDDAFWIGCNSPMILEGGSCYYIESSGDYSKGYGVIKKRNMSTAIESVVLNAVGLWTTSGGGYYTNAYSGLFKTGGRLYYNTPTHICSIPMNGGATQMETTVLSSGDKYVYGTALSRGKVRYLLKTKPGDTTGDILEVTLKHNPEVEVSRIMLDRESIVMKSGEEEEISATIQPSYANADQIVWSSSDENVAIVEQAEEAGKVRINGIGTGNCTITAYAGGKSAECRVTVIGKPSKPIFFPTKTVDKGGQVTISSDPDTVIYYTVNGQDPNPSDKTTTIQYTEPITIEQDTTIKAVAVSGLDEDLISDVAEESFIACTSNLVLGTDTLTIVEGEEHTIEAKELPTTKTEADLRWSSKDLSVATVDESGKVTAVHEGKTVITAEVEDHKGETFTATCAVTVEVPVYEVTFIGFRDKVIRTESVKKGGSATAPEVSEIKFPEGYLFDGWKESYENIQSDTVVNAVFSLIEYRITYVVNGGTGASGNPEKYTVEDDDILLAPPGEKEGFIFTGWYEDSECQGNPILVIEHESHRDITLYAGWRDERGLWMKMADSDEMGSILPQTYTGKAIKPDIEVWYGDTKLSAGKDYTISYKNNTLANLLETEKELKKAPTVTIKGKGNFAGKLVETFVIKQKLIEDTKEVLIDPVTTVYTGKVIRPVPTVLWNGKKLANKKDFIVEYPDLESGDDGAYKAPGTYSVRVTGCGNYAGKRTINFTILDPDAGTKLLNKVKISKIPDQVYDSGNPVVLTADMLKLTDGSEPLVPGDDYDLEYDHAEGCREIGTHQVILTGKGRYAGVVRISFKIKGNPIKSIKIGTLPGLIYSGDRVEFDPDAGEDAANKLVITDVNGQPLRRNVDYTLDFSNCENVGNAKMTITGIGAYTGSMTKTYKILPYSLGEGSEDIDAQLTVEGEQPWQMGGATPKVKISFQGRELVEGTDYTLSYKNNKSMEIKPDKEPTVVIKGRKNFSGSREMTFGIKPGNIGTVAISAPDMEENTRAGKYMSTPVLTDINGKKLKAGTDYDKAFIYTDENGTAFDKTNRPVAGDRVTVTVTGKGNYEGKVQTTFRIIPKGYNISKAKVKVETKFDYTGCRVTLSQEDLVITLGGKTLTKDDYRIVESSYINNINKGTAKVTIQGRGDYGGTKQINFRILSQNMKWWEKVTNQTFFMLRETIPLFP